MVKNLEDIFRQAVADHQAGRLHEAEAAYRQILAANPDQPDTLNMLGVLAFQAGHAQIAEQLLRRAIAVNPNFAGAYSNLGNILNQRGQTKQALEMSRKAVQLQPDPVLHSGLLYSLLHEEEDPAAVFEEYRKWDEQFAKPLEKYWKPHRNDRSPDRRLRIGYVSADFRSHSVSYFLEPLLAHRDRTGFHVTCYSNDARADSTTTRLRGLVDEWRDIVGVSDDAAAELIRGDAIDILVDLAGHTHGNRLLVFARKPAPVQASFLGYPNTTGLSAIDYRITDTIADPPAKTDRWHSEELIRLPGCAWCYRAPADAPAVAEKRPDARGITFASFNAFAKAGEKIVRLWAEILQQTPDSRLLIKSRSFADEQTLAAAREILLERGVPQDRFTILPRTNSVAEHLAMYANVDIALDTFPYHGTTTTCEALWMGVPVITLAGQMHISRVGASLLNAVGLVPLIADDPRRYVKLAVDLASDAARLADFRCTLRDRISRSRLSDEPEYARDVENAYREMWQRWARRNQP